MKLRKKIKVMTAARHGAPIQLRRRCPRGLWLDCPAPRWNWGLFKYRVARSER